MGPPWRKARERTRDAILNFLEDLEPSLPV
jgi:hypothetical protein